MQEETVSSPSGKYVLEITSKETKPGCWNYTKGVVRCGSKEIAVVERNYHKFEWLFVEDHPNGHDYLVTGENYQGQTVIELDTGKRVDLLPEAAKKGFGFCWVKYEYNRQNSMLIVDGCVWAAPYEYRLYDFSDPMSGLPQLEIATEKGYLDSDNMSPKLEEDGSITFYETRYKEEEDYAEGEYDDYGDDEYIAVASTTLRRAGDKMELVSSWIDPVEVERRREYAENRAVWEAKWTKYTSTDPLYIFVKDTVKKWDTASKYFSRGSGKVGIRLSNNQGKNKATLDLNWDWGEHKESVTLQSYLNGKKEKLYTFSHSLEGMKKAFYRAKLLVA